MLLRVALHCEESSGTFRKKYSDRTDDYWHKRRKKTVKLCFIAALEKISELLNSGLE
jgi:hypothetical protein